MEMINLKYKFLGNLTIDLKSKIDKFFDELESENDIPDILFIGRYFSNKDFKYIDRYLKIKPKLIIVCDQFMQSIAHNDMLKNNTNIIFTDFYNKEFEDIISKYLSSESKGKFLSVNNFIITNSLGYYKKIIRSKNFGLFLTGDFGDNYTQLGYWKYNIPMNEDEIKIDLDFNQYGEAKLGMVIDFVNYQGEVICDSVLIENVENNKFYTIKKTTNLKTLLSVSILIRGKGKLSINQLNLKISKGDLGYLTIGDDVLMDHNGHKIYYKYLDGVSHDYLNIYFSGHREVQRFEGWNIIEQTNGKSTLLFSENRLNGGSFFKGGDELEEKIMSVISKTIKKLNISKTHVTISGLSMGTLPALYYGAKLGIKNIVLGKPILSINRLAHNYKVKRPYELGSVLDMPTYLNTNNFETLDEKVYTNLPKIKNTQLYLGIMADDSYDDNFYFDLVKYLSPDNLIHKYILSGDHNDKSADISNWFKTTLKNVSEKNE